MGLGSVITVFTTGFASFATALALGFLGLGGKGETTGKGKGETTGKAKGETKGKAKGETKGETKGEGKGSAFFLGIVLHAFVTASLALSSSSGFSCQPAFTCFS
jgi:hypothetical protein